MKKYYKRILDDVIEDELKLVGGVLIEGPKYCGKTETSKLLSKTHIFLNDIDKKNYYEELIKTKPSLLFKGETPILLDEFQDYPILFDGVRFEIDQRNQKGLFILTGSSVLKDNLVKHSGVGRMSRIRMRPLSLFESEHSKGLISFKSIFDDAKNSFVNASSELKLDGVIERICVGGWPSNIDLDVELALKANLRYIDQTIKSDINRIDGVVKNPTKVRKMLQSFARNIQTPTSISTIANDVNQSNGSDLSTKTISNYINALEKIFIIENTEAWTPNIRSKTIIRTSEKLGFVDPSIAIAIKGLNPKSLLNDFNYLGFLFESLVIRDLKIYAESINGQIYYYRDKQNLECDAVFVLNDGRYGLIEIKMGLGHIEEATNTLLKLKDKLKNGEKNKPSFLMIITAEGESFITKDGILVVPIGLLRN
ncbi:hypothetical protein JN00_0091 [Metamycoplasma subdolum]|uniref:AAA+ superfamily ATPase n=1 Tax=Metamycoplasma subdolum TaxID=92407 RepID=A0A3M0A9G6_9BACT|nr:DUF4143 domain-containing protein [Metamycoplasma subdolum]RMA79045.1 hypothetical protein JN00_0091 [Metamycoplasma subdolum]WPB50568.1 DUF4143 domain-containing protein [Metamycoplasma subdolum]